MNELLSQLTPEMPVIRQTLALEAEGPNTGLVIVDEVKGFAAVGCGTWPRQSKMRKFPAWPERRVDWCGRSWHKGGRFWPFSTYPNPASQSRPIHRTAKSVAV